MTDQEERVIEVSRLILEMMDGFPEADLCHGSRTVLEGLRGLTDLSRAEGASDRLCALERRIVSEIPNYDPSIYVSVHYTPSEASGWFLDLAGDLVATSEYWGLEEGEHPILTETAIEELSDALEDFVDALGAVTTVRR